MTKLALIWAAVTGACYSVVSLILIYPLQSVNRFLIMFCYSCVTMMVGAIGLATSRETIHWPDFMKSLLFSWCIVLGLMLAMGDNGLVTLSKMDKIDPVIVTMSFVLIPVFIRVYETVFKGKQPSIWAIAGLICMVLMLIFFALDERKAIN